MAAIEQRLHGICECMLAMAITFSGYFTTLIQIMIAPRFVVFVPAGTRFSCLGNAHFRLTNLSIYY